LQFIRYPLPEEGTPIISKEILRKRRMELGLTQQQVADGAGIQIQQYHRFEFGDRNIEGASLKVALPICAVLQLDPFTFFPECAEMNKYTDSIKRKNMPIMKEDAIPMLLSHACDLCNEHLNTSYSLDNIVVQFCTLEDAVKRYEQFTAKYGFNSEPRTTDHFEAMLAEAFIGQTNIDDPAHVDGILIRTDPPADLDSPEYYLIMLVHELCHIFCTTHEIPTAGKVGQRFYDLYCAGTPRNQAERIMDGQINAGYAIWREFIAEIVQDIVYQQPSKHLKAIAPFLKMLAAQVRVGNTAAKSAMHRYLSEIMNSWEGSEAETWEELEAELTALDLPFIRIIKHVFDMLHDGACHTIDPDSIMELGVMYLVDMVQNTPTDDMLNYAETYGFKFN